MSRTRIAIRRPASEKIRASESGTIHGAYWFNWSELSAVRSTNRQRAQKTKSSRFAVTSPAQIAVRKSVNGPNTRAAAASRLGVASTGWDSTSVSAWCPGLISRVIKTSSRSHLVRRIVPFTATAPDRRSVATCGYARVTAAARTLRCGVPSPDPELRFLSAARQQWTTNRMELRLISRAHPTTVAIIEESGSMVSGEK